MRTAFNRSILESFVLDEEQVRSLAKILQNCVGESSISAACADDATRSFESVDKLLEYENARSRRIISLSLYSRAEKYTPEETSIGIDITCSTNPTWRTTHISVSVKGVEEWASITMRQLDEVVAGSRPWYSWISKINAFLLWGPFAVTLFVPFVQAELIPSPITIWGLITLGGLSFWPAWGAAYAIRYLFPSGVFLIGQEKARHKTKERVRWMVIPLAITVLGVIISMLV